MLRLFPLIALLIAFCPLPARADLDPELKTPYQLRVPIRFGEQAQFTPDFRREFIREVQGQLQVALAALAKVEVVDLAAIPADERIPIENRFFEQGFPALDGYNLIGERKFHFVRVDFNAGRYEIRLRSFDGSTGLVGPIVRDTETFERPLLARLVTLTIAHDFGIVGTIVNPTIAPDGTVEVKLKGAELGVPLKPWIARNEVMILSQVRQVTKRPTPRRKDDKSPPPPPAPPEVVGNRMTEVYLQVVSEPTGDTVRCKVIQRFQGNPFPKHASVQGYRAIKLGTIETKVRLHIVDPQGKPVNLPGLRVRVLSQGFDEGGVAPNDRNEAIKVGGMFESKSAIPHFAFVKVLVGPEVRAQVPIALLDGKPVQTSVRIEAGADLRARLLQARLDFLTRVAETRTIQSRIFRDLLVREKAGDNRGALKLAEGTLQLLQNDAGTFDEELKALRARFEKDLPDQAGSLDAGDQQLVALRGKITELKEHIDQLKAVVAQENDPAVLERNKKLDAKLREAELLEKGFEFDKAIALYDEVLAEVDQPKVRSRRDKLAAAWKTQDDEHINARKYIFDTMANLSTIMDIRAAVPDIKKSFAKLRAVNDRLTLAKMDAVFAQLAERMNQEIQTLDPANDEQRMTLETSEMLLKEMQDIASSVTKYLQQAAAEPMP